MWNVIDFLLGNRAFVLEDIDFLSSNIDCLSKKYIFYWKI